MSQETDGAERPDEGTGDPAISPEEEAIIERLAARAEGQVDPEPFLRGVGAVEPTEDGLDLRLTEDFAADWLAATERLRDDEAARIDHAKTLFDLAGEARVEEDDMLLLLVADGEEVANWVSEGAIVADLAAHEVIADRTDEWLDVWVDQRPRLLRGLRAFYDVCPLCEGELAITDDTVLSCRQTWEVYALRCPDCGEHIVEMDPPQVQGGNPDGFVGPTEGGFTR